MPEVALAQRVESHLAVLLEQWPEGQGGPKMQADALPPKSSGQKPLALPAILSVRWRRDGWPCLPRQRPGCSWVPSELGPMEQVPVRPFEPPSRKLALTPGWPTKDANPLSADRGA